MLNLLRAIVASKPKPGLGAALGAMHGPVWHVTTGNLTTLLATDRLHCTRVWFGRFCSGQGRKLERVGDHEVLVRCDRCDRVIADVEYQTEGTTP